MGYWKGNFGAAIEVKEHSTMIDGSPAVDWINCVWRVSSQRRRVRQVTRNDKPTETHINTQKMHSEWKGLH